MSTDTILDRLKLNNAEVPGVKTAIRVQPTKPIVLNTLPLVWVRPLGMAREVPATSAGMYEVSRRFLIVCLVGLSQGAALDDSTKGSALLAKVMPFCDAFVDYYMTHPHLKTSTLPSLQYIAKDVSIIDNGPELFKGPDGQEYAGIRPIITITERRFANRLS